MAYMARGLRAMAPQCSEPAAGNILCSSWPCARDWHACVAGLCSSVMEEPSLMGEKK